MSGTALFNILVFLATMQTLFASKEPATYSAYFPLPASLIISEINEFTGYLAWIDRDYPLEMPTGPVSTVEMTLQESTRFMLDDDADKPNWETLITNQIGIGFNHLGPYHYRFISSAYHSLHCVFSMSEDFEKPDHWGNPSHHLIHCLMYMRQMFLCNADTTLEEGDFMTKNFTLDRTIVTRECRDWESIAEWVDENFREWAAFNGVSLDDWESQTV